MVCHFLLMKRNQKCLADSDADWAGDIDTRKSTSGYVLLTGSSADS